MRKLLILPFLIPFSAFAHPISGVVDGDTLRTNVEIIPYIMDAYKIEGTPNIRIDGIDTPEKGASAKCDKEKKLALKATNFLKQRIKLAKNIAITDISLKDKYGRVLANVFVDGKNIADEMVANGLAKRYDGGKKSNWCD